GSRDADLLTAAACRRGVAVLLALFVTCAVGLGLATILLLTVGHRFRGALRPVGLLISAGLALAAGELAGLIWRLPPRPVLGGEVLLLSLGLVVVVARPQWNPIGQAFYGAFLAATVVYLA